MPDTGTEPDTGAEAGGGLSGACTPCPSATADTVYLGGASAGICPAGFLYNGATQDWFSYSDGTSDAGDFIHGQAAGGCNIAADCAYHTSGSGFTGYGAGAGITLNANAIFDASRYNGLDLWLRGFTVGTRGPGLTSLDNVVHVKFVTGPGADPRQGDDYGAYCPLAGADADSCYAPCHIPFAAVFRDGTRSVEAGAPDPTIDIFDPQNVVKIQFELSAYSDSNGSDPVPVSFDVWIDGIAWFN
jgi:hypothetical protein